MKRKQKQAAAGRKPNDPSGPGTPFSVRIPEDILNQLRAAADQKLRGSVSEELLNLVRFALSKRGEERNRSRPLQALFHFIERLDERIVEKIPAGWQSSPYAFGMLRGGIIELLERRRPPGEVVTPPGLMEDSEISGPEAWPADPEECGRMSAGYDLLVAQLIEREASKGNGTARDSNIVRAYRDLGLGRGKK